MAIKGANGSSDHVHSAHDRRADTESSFEAAAEWQSSWDSKLAAEGHSAGDGKGEKFDASNPYSRPQALKVVNYLAQYKMGTEDGEGKLTNLGLGSPGALFVHNPPPAFVARLLGDPEPEKATQKSVDGMISEKKLKPLPKGFWNTPLDKADIGHLRQIIAPKADSPLTVTQAKSIETALKDYEKLGSDGDADKREEIEAELVEYGIDPQQVLTEDLDPKFVARLMGDPDFANATESTPAVLLRTHPDEVPADTWDKPPTMADISFFTKHNYLLNADEATEVVSLVFDYRNGENSKDAEKRLADFNISAEQFSKDNDPDGEALLSPAFMARLAGLENPDSQTDETVREQLPKDAWPKWFNDDKVKLTDAMLEGGLHRLASANER